MGVGGDNHIPATNQPSISIHLFCAFPAYSHTITVSLTINHIYFSRPSPSPSISRPSSSLTLQPRCRYRQPQQYPTTKGSSPPPAWGQCCSSACDIAGIVQVSRGCSRCSVVPCWRRSPCRRPRNGGTGSWQVARGARRG